MQANNNGQNVPLDHQLAGHFKERNISIGSACFMNVPNENGEIEIGYGIYPAFQCRACVTEALSEICRLAFFRKGIMAMAILAINEESNAVSHNVLRECGFYIIDQDSEGIRSRKRSDG